MVAACKGLVDAVERQCLQGDLVLMSACGRSRQHLLSQMPRCCGQRFCSDAMRTESPLACRLAPLSVCLPTVVAEFSRLAQRLGLMECGALLPQRAQAMRAQRPLEMFFPFDPYLLRRSAQVPAYFPIHIRICYVFRCIPGIRRLWSL